MSNVRCHNGTVIVEPLRLMRRCIAEPWTHIIGGHDELAESHRVHRRIDVANQYRHVSPVVTSDAKSPKRVTSIHGVR